MAVAIGAVSVSNVTSSSMMLQATVSAGTAPFSIAWYKSTVPAFVPGPGISRRYHGTRCRWCGKRGALGFDSRHAVLCRGNRHRCGPEYRNGC